ncbi:hypothetical protein BDV41DRAFT_531796 [Aspergillus transmontanensis]|uniref:Secreted protein n=1 Tax=Aspergillus transmontanensis TaxID=1034304 RepID=A0A5N6W3F3_9EURO|nr:hypothetical protein BDV41DRAFT_531796 [Aspergillus transmontanensis]
MNCQPSKDTPSLPSHTSHITVCLLTMLALATTSKLGRSAKIGGDIVSCVSRRCQSLMTYIERVVRPSSPPSLEPRPWD